MILDQENQLSSAQSFSASGASTDYIDQGAAGNIQDGEPVSLLAVVTTAADFTTGDETYTLKAQCDDNTSFSSPTDIASRAILASQLTLGSRHEIPIPVGVAVERYIRAYATLAGTTPSVGLSFYLVPRRVLDKGKLYADNSAIQ